MINSALIRAIAIGMVGLLFILIIFFGVQSGLRRAQSGTVLDNVTELNQAIDYFHSDNNRYPSAVEFASSASMGTYLEPFPPRQFVTDTCQQSYSYRYINQQSYELSYCVSADVRGITEGSHVLTNN